MINLPDFGKFSEDMWPYDHKPIFPSSDHDDQADAVLLAMGAHNWSQVDLVRAAAYYAARKESGFVYMPRRHGKSWTDGILAKAMKQDTLVTLNPPPGTLHTWGNCPDCSGSGWDVQIEVENVHVEDGAKIRCTSKLCACATFIPRAKS